MARIYRKVDLLIMENHKPVPIRAYDWEWGTETAGNVRVFNEGDMLGDFNARWQKVQDKEGNYFNTPQEVTEYLESVFDVTKNELDKNFIFIQNTPSDIWVINHNLNKYPSVNVYDSANTRIVGEENHNNNNILTITFALPVSGKAHLN